MPEWLPAILVFGGVLLGFVGSIFGHRVTAKKDRTTLQLSLLEQIQEERNRLDKKLTEQQSRHDGQVEKLNVRITGFYADKHASRRYVASLEDHIWKGLAPPPPEPPQGYVP